MADTSNGTGHRQRLKERFLRVGEAGMSEHELLELILFYAIPRRDVKPLAKELLRKFHSLRGILVARTEELLTVKGVSMHTAILLQLGRSVLIRCLQQNVSDSPVLDTVKSLELYLRVQTAGCHNEQMFMLLLDKRHFLIEKFTFPGFHDMVRCNPQEIFKSILFYKNVSYVVLAHNHPHNGEIPSAKDISMTRRMQFMLRELNITLKDHLIITPNKCFSILESEQYQPFEPQFF